MVKFRKSNLIIVGCLQVFDDEPFDGDFVVLVLQGTEAPVKPLQILRETLPFAAVSRPQLALDPPPRLLHRRPERLHLDLPLARLVILEPF